MQSEQIFTVIAYLSPSKAQDQAAEKLQPASSAPRLLRTEGSKSVRPNCPTALSARALSSGSSSARAPTSASPGSRRCATLAARPVRRRYGSPDPSRVSICTEAWSYVSQPRANTAPRESSGAEAAARENFGDPRVVRVLEGKFRGGEHLAGVLQGLHRLASRLTLVPRSACRPGGPPPVASASPGPSGGSGAHGTPRPGGARERLPPRRAGDYRFANGHDTAAYHISNDFHSFPSLLKNASLAAIDIMICSLDFTK